MAGVFVGVDWAEAHHDVYVVDGSGGRLDGGRVPDGVEGVARFHAMVAGHVGDPAEVVVATETDRGLFVGALIAAGYTVIAVNPMSAARYRQRHSTSGAKSDPGDAKVLADLARTDAHNHRTVAGDSDGAEAVKTLARAHQSLIWTRPTGVSGGLCRWVGWLDVGRDLAREVDGDDVEDAWPFLDGVGPFGLGGLQGEPEQFDGGVVCGEVAAGLDDLA